MSQSVEGGTVETLGSNMHLNVININNWIQVQ